MKSKSTLITGFVLLLSVGFWPLKSQATPIKKEKISLLSAIDRISQEYDVYFTFDMTLVSEVEVEYERKEYANAEEAVSEILKGTDLKYKFYDRRFVILYKRGEEGLESLKKMSEHLDGLIGEEEREVESVISGRSGSILSPLPNRTFSKVIKAVSFSVEGMVTDEEGEPLIGVNIQVKESNKGTSTDFDGKFTLEDINENDILIISYIGFQTKEIPISGKSSIEIVMISDLQLLDEIIVVGYGTQRLEDITASIDTMNVSLVSKLPVSNVAEAMQAQVPGLNIQSKGGQPGEELDIKIRGQRSLSAGNDPLIVLDGIPFEGRLSDINPSAIESISVLKDASATVIYGSRGANGVILIQTKNGSKNQKTSISLNSYFGVTEPMRMPEMMNNVQFIDYKLEAYRRNKLEGSGYSYSWLGELPNPQEVLTSEELDGYQNNIYTNWPNMVIENGYRQNYNLNVNGGKEKTRFFISGNYFNERGLVPIIKFNRYSIQANVSHDITDKISIGSTINSSIVNRDYNSSPLQEAYYNVPVARAFDDLGNIIVYPNSDGQRSNPLLNLQKDAVSTIQNNFNFFGTFRIDYNITKNISYNLNFAPSIINNDNGNFYGSLTNQNREGEPTAGKNIDNSFKYTLQNSINFDKDFGNSKFHRIKILALQSIERFHQDGMFLNVRGLPFESQKFNNLKTASVLSDYGSSLSEWSLSSFLIRLNYDFKGKYLIQLSERADGSSRLTPGNKWKFFSGASLGWRLSDEEFLRGISSLNFLKLRISYGEVGNTSISPYSTQGGLTRTAYNWGSNKAYGYMLEEIANPNLSWETTNSINLGMDFVLFNSRINGSLDVYKSHTTDLLLDRQLPFTTGYDRILQNIGETSNKGIELSVNTLNFKNNTINSFIWKTNFNFGTYKEQILKLFDRRIDDIGNKWFIGEPISVFYDYEKIGIWQIDERDEAANYFQSPGEIKVRDQNNDGKIDGDDRVVLGSPDPKIAIGVTNMFEYKGFDFSIIVNAWFNRLINSGFHNTHNTLFGRYNNLDVNYWTPNNPTNEYPRPQQDQERPLYNTTLTIFKGDFVKINNISLGYTLPAAIINQSNKMRIYASIDNLYVFSPYKTEDPTVFGTIQTNVPVPRAYLLGIDLNF